MKNVFRILILAAVAATFTLPALAQDTTAASGNTAASAQDEEAKAALYEKWRANYNGSPDQQKVAYEAAKEYTAKYTTEDAYLNAVKKWLPKYEKAVRDFECTKSLTPGNAAAAFQACRQVLSAEPENLKLVLALANVGYADSQKNKSLTGETLNQVRRAIQLVGSGKTVDTWAPFANRDAALGWLHFYHGYLTRESAPGEAADAFIKAAQANGPTKSEPTTYLYLATVYTERDYVPLAAEYNRLYAGKEATPEGEAMFARLNQVMDRVIDSYARAVALSTDPKNATYKNAWMAQLTKFYKARNNDSDTGLNELVAGVLSKPMPMPGDPLPTPAASTMTPATGTPTGTTGTTTTTTTGRPASSSTAKPPATTAPAPKPASASTTPRP